VPIGSSVEQIDHLSAGSTNTLFDITYSGNENLIVKYSIKEETTNNKQVGQLYITSNGTDTSLSDTSTSTGDVQVTFSAFINGSDIRVEYTSAGTEDLDIKYFIDSWSD